MRTQAGPMQNGAKLVHVPDLGLLFEGVVNLAVGSVTWRWG